MLIAAEAAPTNSRRDTDVAARFSEQNLHSPRMNIIEGDENNIYVSGYDQRQSRLKRSYGLPVSRSGCTSKRSSHSSRGLRNTGRPMTIFVCPASGCGR